MSLDTKTHISKIFELVESKHKSLEIFKREKNKEKKRERNENNRSGCLGMEHN